MKSNVIDSNVTLLIPELKAWITNVILLFSSEPLNTIKSTYASIQERYVLKKLLLLDELLTSIISRIPNDSLKNDSLSQFLNYQLLCEDFAENKLSSFVKSHTKNFLEYDHKLKNVLENSLFYCLMLRLVTSTLTNEKQFLIFEIILLRTCLEVNTLITYPFSKINLTSSLNYVLQNDDDTCSLHTIEYEFYTTVTCNLNENICMNEGINDMIAKIVSQFNFQQLYLLLTVRWVKLKEVLSSEQDNNKEFVANYNRFIKTKNLFNENSKQETNDTEKQKYINKDLELDAFVSSCFFMHSVLASKNR